jgi:hypothetical protein
VKPFFVAIVVLATFCAGGLVGGLLEGENTSAAYTSAGKWKNTLKTCVDTLQTSTETVTGLQDSYNALVDVSNRCVEWLWNATPENLAVLRAQEQPGMLHHVGEKVAE